MAQNPDQQHLLQFITQKEKPSLQLRIVFGAAVCELSLQRPTQFPGTLTMHCEVQVTDLPEGAVAWLEAYVKLMAKNKGEYALEQNDHHTYVYYVSRFRSLIESDYNGDELFVEVVTFAVELAFHLDGLLAGAVAWPLHLGAEASLTPEAVYNSLGSGKGLSVLRK